MTLKSWCSINDRKYLLSKDEEYVTDKIVDDKCCCDNLQKETCKQIINLLLKWQIWAVENLIENEQIVDEML